MKKIFCLILLIINYQLLIINSTCAQTALPADRDSSRLRISLLTCTPGEELYSTFGHSAFRVIDSNSVSDIVYNYGTFNFDDEGFYLKFVRGKLLYYISPESFAGFKQDKQFENRGITEQVLNLTASEKISIRHFLNENLKEENRYYKYDFFFDNCTTRLRDILHNIPRIKKQPDSNFCQKPVMPPGTTFRQAIHQYLDQNGQRWSELGIDILLGLPCDAVMTVEQMQFLPDNLMKSLDSSRQTMVLSHQNLYPVLQNDKNTTLTPLVIFSLLLLSIILISLIRSKWANYFLQGFDGLVFFITGVLGIIIILMWTATDHSMCKNNFNLLWAWPMHTVMAFFISSKKRWVQLYFTFTAIGYLLVLLLWFFLPQQMNPGLIPILILLIYRSTRLGMIPANSL